MTRDAIAETALIEISRAQREAIDKTMRRTATEQETNNGLHSRAPRFHRRIRYRRTSRRDALTRSDMEIRS